MRSASPITRQLGNALIPALTQFSDVKFVMSHYLKSVPYNKVVSPSQAVPVDYVHGQAALEDLVASTGPQHLSIRLPANPPLLTTELLTNSIPGVVDFSSQLSQGEVAETINLPVVAIDNGNVVPSDHVDLLITLKFGLTVPQIAGHKIYTTVKDPSADKVTVGASTAVTTPGQLLETQTTIQNMRVLNIVPVAGGAAGAAAANYAVTVALSHQDSLLLKFVRDSRENGEFISYDMTVRSAEDSSTTSPPKPFTTTPVLPDYLVNGRTLTNHFQLP